MAETMEESFRARVDKIFGSLTPSSAKNEPPSSPQSTPWSVTDEAVERKEWRRESSNTDRDEIPCASSFDELSKARKDRRRSRRKKQLDDDDEEDEEVQEEEGNLDDQSDEWDIRSSIGLDRTLDNEEEEDEFDKVAEGRENTSDRLYMKDVNDQGSHLNFYNVVGRDPRANVLAAKARLREEDEYVAEKQKSCDDGDVVSKVEVGKTVSGVRLRPILKRKDSNSDSKSRKRVRFDPECKITCEEYEPENVHGVLEGGSMLGQDASGLPDYLRNPSQYTRYSFDSSSEVDEKSNAQDFMEFLKLVKISKPVEMGSELQEDTSADLPKVAFIPKKKAGAGEAGRDGSKVKQDEENVGFPVAIAVEEEDDADDEMMDGAECNAAEGSSSFKKSGRRYRAKSGQHHLDQ